MADLNTLKAKAEEIVEKIKDSKELLDGFQKEPVKTLEKLIGIDLPDDQVEKLIELIKAKLTAEKVAGFVDDVKEGGLGNIVGKLGGLFGKK